MERRTAAAAAAAAAANGGANGGAVSPSASRDARRPAIPGVGGPLGKPAQIQESLAGDEDLSGPVEVGGEQEEAAAGEEEEEEEEDKVVEESLVQSEDGDEEGAREEEEVQEGEGAQEIDDTEAAQQLGRKRPRRSLPAPSPELGSGAVEESPLPKRRRRREADSPAQQQQQRAKRAREGRPAKPSRQQQQHPPSPPSPPSPQPARETHARPKPKRQPRTKRQARKPRAAGDEDGDDEEQPSGSVAVTVQRFRKPHGAGDAAETDDDPGAKALRGDSIPFANRGGVNAVDVLATLCEELIEAYMSKLEERGRAAEDAATRREQKTMYRALEAFREELRTRLLEHTIALDTLHALQKRVRAAQKERLALRDEILRIRAEREQVALRMDAIRIRHEAASKKALRHMSLSSAMHDIDMAVEKGLAAPELSPAEQKKADLANLELLVSRVADQACTRSDAGGALKQIKEFNAFLERAAAVLERR
ncbi:hypothetical protein VTH06DRAFT_4868 [Thermothelomyces fergusii]